ncbi:MULTISPECIES: hypothetical protein [unclassified Pseudovibrio]|uniref:hypothetical protein n=1 Tax=unclassified Pseudovibrio TaxID=2627060 RepID=UPI00128FBBAA|nr:MULTISPECIES: hypothetical protein [unclassified Pseudovibrio]
MNGVYLKQPKAAEFHHYSAPDFPAMGKTKRKSNRVKSRVEIFINIFFHSINGTPKSQDITQTQTN